jgi:hypothetical protein
LEYARECFGFSSFEEHHFARGIKY